MGIGLFLSHAIPLTHMVSAPILRSGKSGTRLFPDFFFCMVSFLKKKSKMDYLNFVFIAAAFLVLCLAGLFI